jgi:hypothetical protein
VTIAVRPAIERLSVLSLGMEIPLRWGEESTPGHPPLI